MTDIAELKKRVDKLNAAIGRMLRGMEQVREDTLDGSIPAHKGERQYNQMFRSFRSMEKELSALNSKLEASLSAPQEEPQ